MRSQLLKATDCALRGISQARFFGSERGFHGRFYCLLQQVLDEGSMPHDHAILEMEYQKAQRHHMRQRPDIILHAPAEETGSSVHVNNFCVWALKRHATQRDAEDDFEKLDGMISQLQYPLAIFVNIDSSDHCIAYYTGQYRERVVAVGVSLGSQGVECHWSDEGEF